MWKNTATIHSVLKEKNYKLKILASSILKKSTNIILKNKKNKIEKLCEKTPLPQYFKEKKYKAKFLTKLIFKK
jgi:hypothetical protein